MSFLPINDAVEAVARSFFVKSNGKLSAEMRAKRRYFVIALILTYTLFGVFFGLGAAVILMFSWKTQLTPPPQAVQLLQDLPLIFLALLFGALGALIRSIRNPLAETRFELQTPTQVFIGAFIGMFAYFLLESRALIKLVYSNVPDIDSSLTYHGIALVSGLAGMLSRELLGFIEGRASSALIKNDAAVQTINTQVISDNAIESRVLPTKKTIKKAK